MTPAGEKNIKADIGVFPPSHEIGLRVTCPGLTNIINITSVFAHCKEKCEVLQDKGYFFQISLFSMQEEADIFLLSKQAHDS